MTTAGVAEKYQVNKIASSAQSYCHVGTPSWEWPERLKGSLSISTISPRLRSRGHSEARDLADGKA